MGSPKTKYPRIEVQKGAKLKIIVARASGIIVSAKLYSMKLLIARHILSKSSGGFPCGKSLHGLFFDSKVTGTKHENMKKALNI
jgi:hypothetical protein